MKTTTKTQKDKPEENTIVVRWFVFEQDGPYNWQITSYKSGPLWDKYEWFDEAGYDTEEAALLAINKVLKEFKYCGPYFVIKGYGNY